MPPESLPWDRRDFRKHDRSATDTRLGAGGGPNKWRRQQHDPHAPPPYNQQQQQQRWSSDFRSPRLLPPGHSKQGGWPMYSDDAGQGFMPPSTRYADRNLENENCRPFGSRGGGRYFRNNRENRGSFTQKDWKAPTWEPAAVPNTPGEPMTEVNNLRSIENTQPCHNRSSKSSYASHPPLGSVNQSDQSQSPSPSQSLVKEKNGGTTDEPTGEGQESEKENCLAPDLEPLKWSRVGNLSSTSSCISHSTSSRSLGLDSVEVLAEVQLKNSALDQSPSVDVACVRSNAPARSDETGSRKKPRLGWGEGLAKYEKKKVEGPEEGSSKNEPALSSISTESPLSANLLEQSPRVECLLDCASPATPSSVACSSSPGVVEEKSVKEANVVRGTSNMSCFPSIASPGHYGGRILNLENLEFQSIANLSYLINKMQQPNDPSSAETGYMQTTSMNKLLLWKVDILKVLEMTESEIESLETELKLLKNEPGFRCSHPAGPRSLAGERQLNPFGELDTASIWHGSSQVVSSGDITAKDAPVGLEGGHVLSTNEDIDSPGSATSKFVGVLPAIFLSEKSEFSEGARNVEIYNSGGLDKKCSKKVFSSPEIPGYVNNLVPIGNSSLEDLGGNSTVYCNVNNLCSSILSSNRAAASRALEQWNKLLPKQGLFDGSIESIVSSSQRKSSEVMERFLKRKRFLQFKEKVLTLKFKVFQHFWKEGRIVSIRRLRGKTRKKFDPSRNGQKRNRSRVSFYAGGPQAVRADEVINFVNDLLSEFAIKPHRNTLKMPALILDKQLKMSRFISKNGLVEDPCVVEKERSMMNPWTAEETYVFIEKLAAFGKDFRKIASFLDHKTVADCIEFYYKNHKSECFEKARKDSGFLKQRKSQTTTYLVGSGKRRSPELNAASLDMLGAASEIVAKIDRGMDIRQKCTSRSYFGASSSCLAPRVVDRPLNESDNNERETEAADVLAGMCGSLSSEGMSSSITSSADCGGGYQDPSCPRINPPKQSLTPEFTQDVDVECSDESCSELNPTDWSDEEKSIFMQAVSSFGKDFVMVAQSVGTKSTDQCKAFFSKARKCLGLDLIQPVAGTASGDDDGGSSAIEDGNTMETCSGISNGSECKTEEDFPPPGMNPSHESDMMNSGPDFKTSNGSSRQGPLDSMITKPVPENSSTVGGHEGDKPVTDLNECRIDVPFVSVQEPQTVTVAPKMESEHLGMPNDTSCFQLAGNSKSASGHSAQFSVPINYKKARNHYPSWPNNASGIDDAHSQNFVCTGDSQQLLPSYSLSKSTESSQILQGYPVSLQTMVGGASGDASCENLNLDCRADLLLQKCKEARQRSAAFPSLERRRDYSRTQSGCSSAGENPPRNGDVKLFGKILSSSQQKPCNSVERADVHRMRLEFSSGFRQQPKFDCNNHVPTENMPVRSFGFWDGNRIQTGIPPMPDSTFLLAKYPAAFSNFSLPSLHGGSASVSRSISSNGLPEQREMQPQDVFDQMQRRRSAFNVASRMQQHGRGMSGVEVAGRGGVAFGGQFSGVSDPVAAIKMHYARAEQLRMQGGNAIAADDDNNNDRCISNRDVGR